MQNQIELDQLAEELILRRGDTSDGTIVYRNSDGELHRIHGPAVIWADGTEFWFQNNKSHRLDGPATVFPDGRKFLYINGKEYTENQFNAHPLVVQHRAKAVL